MIKVFLKYSFGLIVLTLLSCKPQTGPPYEEKLPNILILIADDAGWEDFGSYGNEYIATPNIDTLAKNGKIATNAFLTIAQCSPSRISILSGRYPHSTGAEDLHMPLPDTIQLLPTIVKQKGYFTGLLKKSHLGPNGDAQFDFLDPSLDAFDQFIDQSGDNPFFLWVGFTDPHRPYEDNIIDNPQATDDVKVLPYWKDDLLTRKDLADYYNEIRRMDDQIGKYMISLDQRNMLNNTLIIFISDNGAPFPRAKGTVYDAGIKTPLIVHWPDQIRPGQSTNSLISLVDLTPTITGLLGLAPPKGAEGTPVKGLFDNEETESREYIFAERNWHNCDEHIRTIRSEQYKLISNAYTELPHGTAADISKSPTFTSLLKSKDTNELNVAQQRLFELPRPEYELYDLEIDPYELNNLINDKKYDAVATELRLALDKWIMQTNDFPPSERRRKDNTNRFTGEKFDQTKLPPWIMDALPK